MMALWLSLVLAGILIAAPAAYTVAAGPGGGPHVKAFDGNTGAAAKGDGKYKEHIEIDSWSLGATQQAKPGAPNGVKSPDQKPAGLLVPAIQKYQPAADEQKKEEKKPTYPGPGVETWQGKRFPPPAPAQPALEQK